MCPSCLWLCLKKICLLIIFQSKGKSQKHNPLNILHYLCCISVWRQWPQFPAKNIYVSGAVWRNRNHLIPNVSKGTLTLGRQYHLVKSCSTTEAVNITLIMTVVLMLSSPPPTSGWSSELGPWGASSPSAPLWLSAQTREADLQFNRSSQRADLRQQRRARND